LSIFKQKILIISASRSPARFVIKELQENKNLEITLFIGNRMRIRNTSGYSVEGDAMHFADLKKAVEGQDIVYINLAGNLETKAKNIVEAIN